MYETAPKLIPGLVAAADYSAAGTNPIYGTYERRFVYLSAAGTVTVCSSATQRPIGVLLNRPKAGEVADVAELRGLIAVQADAAITAGQYVGTSSDGQAAAYTYGSSTTNFVCGIAVTTTTNTGAAGLVTIAACTPHRAA